MRKQEQPYFIVQQGKDRTGFGAFLLLSSLEVDQSTIKQDYLATNRYLGPFKEEICPYGAAKMPPRSS